MKSVSNKSKIPVLFFINFAVLQCSIAEENHISADSSLRDSVIQVVEPNYLDLKLAEVELSENILAVVQNMDSGELDVLEGRSAIKNLLASFRQIRAALLHYEDITQNFLSKNTHAQIIYDELNAAIQLDGPQEEQIRQLLSQSSSDTLDSYFRREVDSEGIHFDSILFGNYEVEDQFLEQKQTQFAFEEILHRVQLIQLLRLKNTRRTHYGLEPIKKDILLKPTFIDTTQLK